MIDAMVLPMANVPQEYWSLFCAWCMRVHGPRWTTWEAVSPARQHECAPAHRWVSPNVELAVYRPRRKVTERRAA